MSSFARDFVSLNLGVIMCGIFCCISSNNSISYHNFMIPNETKKLLQNRGPDVSGSHYIKTEFLNIYLAGFVLWQQGSIPQNQPVIEKSNILLFNGDIFMDECERDQSDTGWLANKIEHCNDETDLMKLFQRLRGPYSIIIYNKPRNSIYFARDSLGRQTLLIGKEEDTITLTSVSASSSNGEYIELPPLGIYKISYLNGIRTVSLFPWQCLTVHSIYTEQFNKIQSFLDDCEIIVQKSIEPQWLTHQQNSTPLFSFETIFQTNVFPQCKWKLFDKLLTLNDIHVNCNTLIHFLSVSVKERIETTPNYCKKCVQLQPTIKCDHTKIGILFSGGIDCTILAVLADKYVNPNETIDLINVSFEKIRRQLNGKIDHSNDTYNTPDRQSAQDSLQELRGLCPKRKWELVEVNVTRHELEMALVDRISNLMTPLCSVLDSDLGAALWFAAGGNGENYKSSARVLLIGSGADELFGGYTRHRNAYQRATSEPWQKLTDELDLDWIRLPSRNLARDDRAIGDHGITARSPYVHENLTAFVRQLRAEQKCYFGLEQGIGDKLLLRLCAYQLGLRNVCWLKKRALQFGSRIADSKQNAKDISIALKHKLEDK